jgi:hypothetical protein
VPAKDQFPDAQLKAGDATLNLEVTMALRKNRPMYKEWREWRTRIGQGEIISSETDDQRRVSAREAIPRVVGKKANKHYPTLSTTLLVHADDGRALSEEEWYN